MIELTALITGTVITSLIALIVFAKNNRSITTRLFLILTVGLVGWSITTYLSLHTSTDAQTLFWIRWIMFFVVLQNTSLFLLIRVFPASQFDLFKKKYIIAIVYSVITAGVALSPLLFIGFKESPIPGPGMMMFLPHALVSVVGGLITLIIRTRKARGLEKNQFQFLLAGTILMFTFEPMGNFVAPVLFKQNQLVVFSPLYSIIFSVLIAYAIIRHRLFDIRIVVARAVAYILLVTILGGAYVVTTLVSTSIFLGNTASRSQLIVYSILTLIVAFTFQPLRSILEKITDRVFFKGKYDSQKLLSNLTKIMATTLGLRKVTEKLLVEMLPEMRISKGAFVLIEKGKVETVESVGFDKKQDFVGTDILSLLEKKKVIFYEEENQKSIKKIMRGLDATVSVPLEVKEGELGILLLGHKLSGEIYTDQDIKLLEILSPEISIAIQNSKAYEEIRQFNIKLAEKVEKATSDLVHANEKLKELDKLKDEFMSIASHELRTPMTAIKSYVWLSLHGKTQEKDKKVRAYLDKVFESSERMISMINDMLNVNRIETGRMKLDIIPVSVWKVAEQVKEELTAKAAESGIKIIINKDNIVPLVMSDKDKLIEIFTNLIGNSLKFTHKGGEITVTARKTGTMVEIQVSDTGVGIAKENLDKLFKKYGKLNESYATVSPSTGTGLGLYITKQYLEKMGGKIGVDSIQGKGTTFTFSLHTATGKDLQLHAKEEIQPSGIILNPKLAKDTKFQKEVVRAETFRTPKKKS